MDINALKRLLNDAVDQWAAGVSPTTNEEITEVESAQEPDLKERTLPEGKRVVRTKSSGDRVYYLDEDKKTRQWITNPEVLQGLGFEIGDVVEVEDQELLGYNMAAALYKVPNADS